MTIIQLISTSLMTVRPYRIYFTDVAVQSNLINLFVSNPRSFLIGIDIACLIYFVLEFLLRFFAARNFQRFLLSPLNLNDLATNIASFATVIILLASKNKSMTWEIIFYIARVPRIFRFLRYIPRLEVILITYRSCKREIILFLTFFFIITALSGTLIYLAELVEEQPDNKMTNIFSSFYYAIVSWTTVGYGDIVPKSSLSQLFTVFICWMAPVLVILPIPLMAKSFSFYYRHFVYTVKRADLRGRLRMKRILQRIVEDDPQFLYTASLSSSSSVTA